MRRPLLPSAALLGLVGLFSACSVETTGAGPTGAPPPAATATPTPGGGSSSGGDPTPKPPEKTATTIRVHYTGRPGALSLRGSAAGLSWDASAPLADEGAGTFTWKSEAVTAALEVKPMLDGAWSKGPNYRVKPGATLDVYPRFATDAGAYEKKWPAFTSTALPSTRGVWIYLPPTYLENQAARFPVLYMHDGQNLFSKDTAFGGNEWKVDETLDAGAYDGSIREVIVVGVENTAARIDELTPTSDPGYGGGKLPQYLAMVRTEIKPLVDATFRTIPGREATGIMGSSLGGLASSHAGVVAADVFGLVGAMSPSTWWDDRMILGEVATTPTKPARPLRVYVDCGDAQDGLEDTKDLAAGYEAVGYTKGKDFSYVVQPGAKHNEIYWAQRLPVALSFLLGKRADLD